MSDLNRQDGSGASQSDSGKPKDDAVESRSADPGQSSYGGFKNQGPSVQNDHQPEDDDASSDQGPAGKPA